MGLITCNFLSYSLNRDITVNIILPSLVPAEINHADIRANTHRHPAKFPILYLLHGHAGDYSSWCRYTSIERYAEERNIAVVTFSAENKPYINIEGSGFTRDHIYDLLRYELPDFLGSVFPVSTEPKDQYIAGLSMGGVGTMLHTFTHPEDYAAAGILSMSFEPSLPGDLCDRLEAAYAEARADGKVLPPIYTACGGKDGLYANWLKMVDRFAADGVKFVSAENPQLAHEWAFWDEQIVKFLDWIPRTDAYVNGAARKV